MDCCANAAGSVTLGQCSKSEQCESTIYLMKKNNFGSLPKSNTSSFRRHTEIFFFIRRKRDFVQNEWFRGHI